MAFRTETILVLLFLLLPSIGCRDDSALSPALSAPEIVFNGVAKNPHNVLSAVVTLQVRNADSVAVEFGFAGEPPIGRTPARLVQNDAVTLPVLGLRVQTAYTLHVVAYRGSNASKGTVMTISTGALPADLPKYVATGKDPSPGYVVFAADPFAIAIDNTGAVVWYRRFVKGTGLNFQALSAGRYVTRPPPTDPMEVARWLELDALGDVTRTLGCVGGLQPRFHDLLLEADGSYWIMCDETRTMDLSGIGGINGARVTGTVIQRVSEAGTLLFQWTPFDHFAITDLPASERNGPLVNWTHGNALALDSGGDLLVSFRSLNEITKIDTRTSAVIWRMGGMRNQFAFYGTTTPAFARQHGLRATASNELLMLDNSGNPAESRAERYVYNEGAKSAHLAASYGSGPPVIAMLGGTVQDLPGNRTLVAYGNGGRVEEYDKSGNVVWRLEDPGYVFRAQRINSLYQPDPGLQHPAERK